MTETTSDFATLLGGEKVQLSRAIGEKKEAFVKCLPVRLFPEYAKLIDKEFLLIELATDLSFAEIDGLTPDDSGVIFNKIHELNFNPFSDWLKRKVEAKKLQAQAYGIDLPKTNSETNTDDIAS